MANLQAKGGGGLKKSKYKPPAEWRCIPHERGTHTTLTALEKWRGQHTTIKDPTHDSIIHNSILNFFALKVFQAELPNSLSLTNTTRTTGNTYRKSLFLFSILLIHSIHFMLFIHSIYSLNSLLCYQYLHFLTHVTGIIL